MKDALLEFETLDKEEIMKILRGEKLKRLEVQLQEEEEKTDNNNGGRGSPQPKKEKEVGPKGGVGIKLPDVLLPQGGRAGEQESARVSDR